MGKFVSVRLLCGEAGTPLSPAGSYNGGMEDPAPDDPDRFEERLRSHFLVGAAAIFLALAIGLGWLSAEEMFSVIF